MGPRLHNSPRLQPSVPSTSPIVSDAVHLPRLRAQSASDVGSSLVESDLARVLLEATQIEQRGRAEADSLRQRAAEIEAEALATAAALRRSVGINPPPAAAPVAPPSPKARARRLSSVRAASSEEDSNVLSGISVSAGGQLISLGASPSSMHAMAPKRPQGPSSPVAPSRPLLTRRHTFTGSSALASQLRRPSLLSVEQDAAPATSGVASPAVSRRASLAAAGGGNVALVQQAHGAAEINVDLNTAQVHSDEPDSPGDDDSYDGGIGSDASREPSPLPLPTVHHDMPLPDEDYADLLLLEKLDQLEKLPDTPNVMSQRTHIVRLLERSLERESGAPVLAGSSPPKSGSGFFDPSSVVVDEVAAYALQHKPPEVLTEFVIVPDPEVTSDQVSAMFGELLHIEASLALVFNFISFLLLVFANLF